MNELDEVYELLTNIFFDVFSEHDEAEGDRKVCFQGKKDGLRTALVLLAPFFDKDRHWEIAQETATTRRYTQLEKAIDLLDWAYTSMDDWLRFSQENSLHIENWKRQIEILKD